jgi:hypothetical protein
VGDTRLVSSCCAQGTFSLTDVACVAAQVWVHGSPCELEVHVWKMLARSLPVSQGREHGILEQSIVGEFGGAEMRDWEKRKASRGDG